MGLNWGLSHGSICTSVSIALQPVTVLSWANSETSPFASYFPAGFSDRAGVVFTIGCSGLWTAVLNVLVEVYGWALLQALPSCSSVAHMHVHAHTCTESGLLLRFISYRQKTQWYRVKYSEKALSHTVITGQRLLLLLMEESLCFTDNLCVVIKNRSAF